MTTLQPDPPLLIQATRCGPVWEVKVWWDISDKPVADFVTLDTSRVGRALEQLLRHAGPPPSYAAKQDNQPAGPRA